MERRTFLQWVLAGSAGTAFSPQLLTMEPTMFDRVATTIKTYASQGDHRTGTDTDNLSAQWLASRLKALGIESELQPFEFSRTILRDVRVKLNEAWIPGVPLYDCAPDQQNTQTTGTLGELGSDADIGVIMSLPFEQSPPFQAVNKARHAGRHKAIIIVTDQRLPPNGIALVNAESYRTPFGPPVIQIANEHWSGLQQLMAAKSIATCIVDMSRQQGQALNVTASIKGKDESLAPVVVMTPRSGWWQCASERGGGIATLLEIARACRVQQPRRSVIFTANSGHELSHLGLDHYLEENHQLIKNAHIWVHLGANFVARHGLAVRLQHSDDNARSKLKTFTDKAGISAATETPVGTRPVGEARNIFDGGGRFISIVSNNGLFHHPADTYPAAVDLNAGISWVSAMTSATIALAND